MLQRDTSLTGKKLEGGSLTFILARGLSDTGFASLSTIFFLAERVFLGFFFSASHVCRKVHRSNTFTHSWHRFVVCVLVNAEVRGGRNGVQTQKMAVGRQAVWFFSCSLCCSSQFSCQFQSFLFHTQRSGHKQKWQQLHAKLEGGGGCSRYVGILCRPQYLTVYCQ